ncbi:hypothetical protein ACT6SE_05365 [Stenotrophomonas sp. LC732]|uniref:hypothetical protein n=1 Tax=Stenotrophomonas TaxID=40323 RepID=UPI0006219398|nr:MULTISPECIES: hypothetical protein [Stenotrophomonas]KKF85838.1 hypothetical protein XY58_22500 [Stenotrophomonas maltophilia]MBA0453415.1 hypothetical protein [Stenotrophomonas maltophilia]MBF9139956.1 hypothetical protein [Stenotrophomonas sp. 232]MBH1517069.1 hypothetical protein [Stenotrophomonas maltophilia]MBH1777266.1 hypothetical protein [Stenotrophomonas maltophilia]
MKIHTLATDGSQVIAITQAASSGGKYGHPVMLSAIRFDLTSFDQVMEELNKNGHRHEKSFEVIERWRVDARNQGPRSRFGETLAALREEVGDNLKGNVLFATEDEAEDAVESFKPMTRAIGLDIALPAANAAARQPVRF